MTVPFDLTLLPLYRIHGQEMPQIPGLLAVTAPKHAARGRENDLLVIHLSLAGNAPVSSDEYKQISVQMAQRYFQVPGALTSALRTTAELLNQFLIERNMRTTGQGHYVIGRMVLAVLRDGQMTLAQCGPTHVFHLTESGMHAVHDGTISGRGLGISQSTPLYLAQREIKPADRLVFCSHCPGEWESSLPVQSSGSLEYLRRSLLDATNDDLSGVLLEMQSGVGRISLLQGEQRSRVEVSPPVPAAPEKSETPAVEQAAVEAETVPPAAKTSAVETAPAGSEGSARSSDAPVRLDLQQPGRFVRPLPPRPAVETAPEMPEPPAVDAAATPPEEPGGMFIPPREREEIPEISRPENDKNKKIYRTLAHGLRSIRAFFTRISDGSKRLLGHMLPSLDGEGDRTGSAKILGAIAIPLILITIAVVVYYKYGKSAQYEEYYNMAVGSALGAIEQSDPAAVRVAWESTLDHLDKAETYQVTDESRALRDQAESALDGRDGILRLDFRAAIYGGLDEEAQISRMAATGTELYLLDAATGKVLLFSQTTVGYQIDLTFLCGPGTYSFKRLETDQAQDVVVGALIDVVSMPGGNDQNATVVAIDANRNLLYCAPGKTPEVFVLDKPNMGMGEVRGFTLGATGKEMFVMDGNSVWIYHYGNYVIQKEPLVKEVGPRKFINPVSYFSGMPMAEIEKVVDLAVNGSDLFLLFEDNHVAVCTYSGLVESPTTCQNPAVFTDNRVGHSSGVTISDAVFSQLMFDSPYNTALFLLEPNTHAVFMVNPYPSSLELAGQFHASWEMEKKQFLAAPATVMAVDTNRYLYLCIGDQVYYTAMP